MRTMMLCAVLFSVVLGISGCLWVAMPSKIVSESVVGRRYSEDGAEQETIVRVDGMYRRLYFLSPDGSGLSGRSFHTYVMEMHNARIPLNHLPFVSQDRYLVLIPFIPLPDGRSWAAVQPSRLEQNYADLNVYIFDSERIMRQFVVIDSQRRRDVPLTRDNRDELFTHYVVEQEVLKQELVFTTRQGEYRIDMVKMDRATEVGTGSEGARVRP